MLRMWRWAMGYKSQCNKKKNKSEKTEKSECVLYTAFATSKQTDEEWLIDSGASKHMTHIDFNFENIKKLIEHLCSGKGMDIVVGFVAVEVNALMAAIFKSGCYKWIF